MSDDSIYTLFLLKQHVLPSMGLNDLHLFATSTPLGRSVTRPERLRKESMQLVRIFKIVETEKWVYTTYYRRNCLLRDIYNGMEGIRYSI
jgi:hypothetical protein